jgi:spore maturation protein CgeB
MTLIEFCLIVNTICNVENLISRKKANCVKKSDNEVKRGEKVSFNSPESRKLSQDKNSDRV